MAGNKASKQISKKIKSASDEFDWWEIDFKKVKKIKVKE